MRGNGHAQPGKAPCRTGNAEKRRQKKDSLALYGLPKAHKISHIKKISLPRYPPTLRRPRETPRGPARGVVYKNRAILWERGAPLPLAPGCSPRRPAGGDTSNSGGFCCKGGCFTQFRFPLQKEKGRGTMSTTPHGLPLCLLAGWRKGFFHATKLRLVA